MQETCQMILHYFPLTPHSGNCYNVIITSLLSSVDNNTKYSLVVPHFHTKVKCF